jgi:hypothetical protein
MPWETFIWCDYVALACPIIIYGAASFWLLRFSWLMLSDD